MKAPATILLCMLMLISLCGCTASELKRPETNLEFWIAENVQDFDFSGYQQKYGLMGGREYYGKGYEPTTDENGEQIDPEECVIYTVTKYPDYSCKNSHITRILITDPDVNVYGLTMNSNTGDIEKTMRENGFESVPVGNMGKTEWVKGKVHVMFSEDEISIRVEVSNIMQIQF